MPKGRSANLLGQGNAALARADWGEARALFEEALVIERSAEAYEGLSWSAFWQNDAECLFPAREKAYRSYQKQSDTIGAARMAVWMASDYLDFRGEPAIASGWRNRARSLLAGSPLSREHGWLALFDGEAALLVEEDTPGALRHAREAGRVAKELGDPDVETVALAIEGLALVTEGRIGEGMPRLDEAAASALGGDLRQKLSVPWTLCYVLYACERARDYDRAAQWCDRLRAYADAEHITVAQGVCRAHYAGLLIWHGKWNEAESELSSAQEYILASRPPMAAEAVVRLAELRRRQGRFEDARALFGEVEWHPLALLGLAELAVAEGRLRDAEELLRRSLRHVPENSRTQRADALGLLARVLSLQGDHEGAGEAQAALQAISETIASNPLRAATGFSDGVVAAAAGDHVRAAERLEDAVDLYERTGAPYEAALARLELARSLTVLGRAERARTEARNAARELEALGAKEEAGRAMALVVLTGGAKQSGTAKEPPLTARQLEILRLVAGGLTDREIAAMLILSEHTVHRHVKNLLLRLGLPSRAAAAAYAGRAGLA